MTDIIDHINNEDQIMRENDGVRVALEQFMNRVFLNAERGGWHKDETFGDKMSLIHSEISEALEEYRDGRGVDEIYYSYKGEHGEKICTPDMYREVDGVRVMNKPEGIAVELADAIIRILDWSAWKKAPILEALFIKAAYNETRSFRHGGKVI